MPEAVRPVINIAEVPLRENTHGEDFKALIGSFGGSIGYRDGA